LGLQAISREIALNRLLGWCPHASLATDCVEFRDHPAWRMFIRHYDRDLFDYL
jgi:hypothetical protein